MERENARLVGNHHHRLEGSAAELDAELQAARAEIAALRARLAEATADQPNYLAAIAAAAPVAMYTFSLEPARCAGGAGADGAVKPADRMKIRYASPAFARITGLSLADGADLTRAFFERVDPSETPRLLKRMGESLRSLQPWREEFRYHHPGGAELWLEGFGAPSRSAAGVVLWHGVLSDVTRRKQAEAEILDSQAWLLMAQQLGAVGLWEHDPTTNRSRWSLQSYTLYGLQPGNDADDQAAWESLVYPEDLRAMQAAEAEDHPAGQVQFVSDYRIRRPDGQTRWISSYRQVTYDESGRPVRRQGASMDVTERKQAELFLRRYELLARHSRDIVLMIRKEDGRILEANAAAERAYGYSYAELLERSIFDLRVQAKGFVQTQMGRASQDGLLFETVHVRKDGSSFPVEVSSQGATIDGQPMLVSIIRDITERYESQALLTESEEMFSVAFKTIPLPTTIVEVSTGRYVMANDAACQTLGLKSEEILSLNVRDLPVFADADKQTQAVRIIEKEGRLENFEAAIRTKTGEVRDGLFFANYLMAGSRLLLLTIMQDITASKRAVRQLQESEERYRIIFEGSREGIITLNLTQKRVEYVNPAASAMFGFTPAEFSGLDYLQVFSEGGFQELISQVNRKGAAQNPTCREIQCRKKDGSLFYVDINYSNMELDGADFIVGFITDATTRRQNEALLRARLWLSSLTSELKVTDLMRIAIDQAEVITDSQSGFFHFVDDSLGQVLLQSWSTNTVLNLCSVKGFERHFALAQAGIWADSLRTNQPVIYNDYPARAGASGLPEGHSPITRYMSIVIERDGRPVAILGLANKPSDYTRQDVEVVTLLANEAWDMVLRLQAEAGRRETEEKYRSLLHSLDASIVMVDAVGVYHYANSVAAAGLGLDEQAMIGRPMADFYPKPVVDDQLQIVRRVIRNGVGEVGEAPSILRGKLRWMRTNVQPVRDASGEVTLVIINSEDISELKETRVVLEEKVKARTAEIETVRQRLELATRAGGLGIWDWDLKSGRLIWDDQMYRLYGLDRREFAGDIRGWENWLHPDDLAGEQALLQAVLRGEKEYESEFRILWPDRSVRHLRGAAVTLRSVQGQPLRMIGVDYDITQQKAAEQVLRTSEEMVRRANRELERAMQMKDEFLASMSHELRTPLTGILGLSEALQMKTYGELNEKQAKALSNIESSGQHLLELINDILDVSKIEAGRLELAIEPCSLGVICLNSSQMVRGMLQRKKQQLEMRIEPNTIDLMADSRRIKQILVNLLSNAIKFSPEGKTVGLEVVADSQARKIHMTVWDQGIGIHADDMPRLFQPFVQLDSSLSRQHAGTGLGLVLVKRLVELHRGTIAVESSPGAGSRFTVTLDWEPVVLPVKSPGRPPTKPLAAPVSLAAPANPAAPAIPAAPRTASISQPAVLLVDDNDVNRVLLADYLELRQLRVIQASSGLEFLSAAPQVMPDLVLMDIQMPGMDGFETIRQLRAHPNRKLAAVPVIALTALVMPGDRERCLEAGANAYISKPANLVKLMQTIRELLKAAGA
jgi:PAS domain S-box-containing protein